MKANEAKLLRFLGGPKQFIVPIYQRRHSWNRSHCKQLWNDVYHAGENENTEVYFLGSIVSMLADTTSPTTVPAHLVIDGQQRLTTLSLLISALGRAIEVQKIDIGIDRRRLENYYLFNADEEGELHYKQILTEHDKDTLIQLLKEGKASDKTSLLVENYRLFETNLKSANLETVYKGIQKLMVVDISLDPGSDNPQLIFESINSTGVNLAQADLIRNYVLLGQERDFQNRLYKDYWYPMEERFGEAYTKRFGRFIRDYLTLRTRDIPPLNSVYDHFKRFMDEAKSPKDLEIIIQEINHYSDHYIRIMLDKEGDSEIRACFKDILDLNVEVVLPFLLEVYEDYTKERILKTKIIEILRLIESYIFRRSICEIPTHRLSAVFAELMEKVNKDNYLESLKFALAHMPSYNRYPMDMEFKQALVIKDIYNSRLCSYLLRKLENYGRKEPISVNEYSIEHVMPQNLTEEWRKELGENWEEVHEKYLHTIGNLTLTGYNAELSNRPFTDKWSDVFIDSPLRLNQSLAKADKWNEAAIQIRSEQLYQIALEIWADLGVQRQEPERSNQKKKQTYTLSDHRFLIGEIFKLFRTLEQYIQELGSVNRQILKTYIIYKTKDTVFISVKPQAKGLLLVLNLLFSEIDDPLGLCEDITNKRHIGTGDVRVDISDPDQLDYIMYLVNQAFQKQREKERDK